MRVIDLDAAGWKTPGDFYNALLPELGAPEWHGHNANALNDSVIWGGINAVNPPLVIRVRRLSLVSEAVADAVKWAKRGIDLGREDFRAQHRPRHRRAAANRAVSAKPRAGVRRAGDRKL